LIPVYQTRIGKTGNCLAACLASICETSLPEFGLASDLEYDQRMTAWLAKRGLRYQQVPVDDVNPVGWTTIEGISPRGGLHACVAFNGRLIFDPHRPDGTGNGLTTVEYYGLLLPLTGYTTDSASPYAPGDRIVLPGTKKRAVVSKVTTAKNLFGEPEWHVSTTTGEVVTVAMTGRAKDGALYEHKFGEKVVVFDPDPTPGVITKLGPGSKITVKTLSGSISVDCWKVSHAYGKDSLAPVSVDDDLNVDRLRAAYQRARQKEQALGLAASREPDDARRCSLERAARFADQEADVALVRYHDAMELERGAPLVPADRRRYGALDYVKVKGIR